MAGKKTGKRLLTWVLVLVMALSLLPLNALAAGGPETDSSSGMIFTKQLVSDEPDNAGNYTIQMTAQATGKTTTTSKAVPMDIVLVLDQSGSMADGFGNGTRQSAMKEAVNSFIGEVANKYSPNADHHMAIVTFGSNADTLENWTAVDSDGATKLTGKISALSNTPSGATNVGAGMTETQSLMSNAPTGQNRQKTVIVFTDGVPTTYSDFDTGVANNAISAAKAMKDDDVTIYTVGIFNGADSAQLHGDKWNYEMFEDVVCDGSVGSCWGGSWLSDLFGSNDFDSIDVPAGNRFLNYLSSNSKNASEVGITKGTYHPGHTGIAGGTGWRIDKNADCTTNQGYYKTAVDASSLNGIFKTISDKIVEPDNAALDEKTVITDTLSDYFTFATGTTDDVKVYTKKGDEETDITDEVTVNPNPQTKTVTVTNYDFSAHYQGIGGNAEETLVIKIKVKPDTSYTNWGASGKYKTNKGNATVTLPNIEKPIAEAASPEVYVATYKVTYQPGEGSGTAYADQYYPNGATTKVKASDTFTAPNGYKFDCWKDKNNKSYQVDDEITFDKSNVILTAQWKLIEAAEPTPATVTLRETDANGNALINKHLTITAKEVETIKDAYFCVAVTAADKTTEAAFNTEPRYATTTTVERMTRTSDGTAVEGSFVFPEQSVLTFTEEGTYAFTVKEVFDEHIKVNHTTYDDAEYTMTVNVTKDEGENKLNAAVSFKNGDDPVNEGYITFNNTYTAPAYPVYVYAFFAHNGTPLKGNVTVNGNPIEWNEDANNEYKEYFVTLGVYPNGTTKKPTDNAMGLDLDALKGKEYEPATGDGSGTKNSVTLDNITNYPSPYGKVCKGAAGYPKIRDELSWHLDGQVNVYTVTYDYNGGTAQGAHTSNGYYFGNYTTDTAPKRDGYTFTVWKDSDGTVYDADSTINKLSKDLKLVAQWTARTDLSYTVNYLEKDTNIVLHEKKIQTGVTFGAKIDSADEIITINGYNYDSADKDKLTIGTDESKNVINIYYTKRTDLSYTVHYYLKNTTKQVADDKTVNGQTFNADVTEKAIRISGYRVYGDSVKSITIGTGTNEIIFYYTRASRPSASSTSKPTLNTGDHYAYVMGYPDGTVRPNGSITRAEVSAILFRLLSDKTRDEYFTTESSFTDVKAGAWYNNSIATLEKAGVIVDTAKGGAFRPNEAITRAELAAMLAQFSDAKPVKGVKFSDVSAEHWAYEAIAIAAKMGWIEGYPDGTFRPDATITRAEMMTLVNRALERVPSDEDHLLSKRVMLTFPDCKSGDWFYIAVQEATNSHTYERAATEKNGDEQWTALRANRDWTLLEK